MCLAEHFQMWKEGDRLQANQRDLLSLTCYSCWGCFPPNQKKNPSSVRRRRLKEECHKNPRSLTYSFQFYSFPNCLRHSSFLRRADRSLWFLSTFLKIKFTLPTDDREDTRLINQEVVWQQEQLSSKTSFSSISYLELENVNVLSSTNNHGFGEVAFRVRLTFHSWKGPKTKAPMWPLLPGHEKHTRQNSPLDFESRDQQGPDWNNEIPEKGFPRKCVYDRERKNPKSKHHNFLNKEVYVLYIN